MPYFLFDRYFYTEFIVSIRRERASARSGFPWTAKHQNNFFARIISRRKNRPRKIDSSCLDRHRRLNAHSPSIDIVCLLQEICESVPFENAATAARKSDSRCAFVIEDRLLLTYVVWHHSIESVHVSMLSSCFIHRWIKWIIVGN